MKRKKFSDHQIEHELICKIKLTGVNMIIQWDKLSQRTHRAQNGFKSMESRKNWQLLKITGHSVHIKCCNSITP